MQPRFHALIFPLILAAIVTCFLLIRFTRPIERPLQQIPVPAKPAETVPSKKLETSSTPNERFGFIQSIQTGTSTFIVFDEAEFISNAEPASTTFRAADEAMIEDGACQRRVLDTDGTCAPNGFYIRNNSTSTTLLEIEPTARVEVLSQSELQPVRLSVEAFKKAFLYSQQHRTVYDENDYFALVENPYLITLKNGKIVKLISRYIP